MRVCILVLFTLASIPLHAQNSNQPPPSSSNHVQVQAALDRAIAGTTNNVIIDLDSALLRSAANSNPAMDDFDGISRKLIGSLRSIQLRMFDIEGSVAGRLQPVRDLLKVPQWSRYAAYMSGPDQIEIWSGRDGERQTGVLLLSITGNRVFAMNVTGDIRPDQLIYLSGRFGIPRINEKLNLQLDGQNTRPATPPVPPGPPPPPAKR
jgi:hypothetical protein